jgi:auxin efflux carrier family protein
MSDGFAASFSGAVQASVSVLLTIGCGVLLTQFSLLNETSAKEISATCIKVFLPVSITISLKDLFFTDC